MHDFGTSMARLQSFRRKFEELLERAREKSPRRPVQTKVSANLREITAFGRNPGNLRMFMHVPEKLPAMAPLVVALHGCSQSAADYDLGTGWSAVADRLGFVVLYPEQQPANNPKNCFSWFLPADTARDQGEAASIRQMIEHASATFNIDRRRIFVTGLSAGGAMATVMLATYPDVFAGGAVIAGLPYGSARTVQQAFEAMFTARPVAAPALGDRVRAASKLRGPWPKLSVWHGTADTIVNPSNAEDLIRQWTDVHGLAEAPSSEESIGGHRHRVWNDADGNATIEAFSIAGMGHGVPLGSAAGEKSCGVSGPFFLEAGIASTQRIADFWRLNENHAEAPRVSVVPAVQHAAAAAAADNAHHVSVPATAASHRAPDTSAPMPAAFRAKLPRAPSFDFAPGPIIEAALKAAGLKR